MKTFLQYLQEQHARNYTGTDDDAPDDFMDWLENMDEDEHYENIVSYVYSLNKEGIKELSARLISIS